MDETTEKIITKIVETHLKAISKKVDTLQTTLDRAIAQLDDDRKEISDLRVNMGKLGASVDGARDDIADSGKKFINRVDEHLAPVPEMVSDSIKEEINKVKTKKWYQLFKGVKK